MHRLTVTRTPTNGWKPQMGHNKVVKILFALLALLIVLTTSSSVAQNSLPLKVDVNTLVNVPSANVIWAKTYGGAADDRAFYAMPTNEGYLVAGSSRSIVENATVGWVLKLNGNGDAVWNKTFLEGWGTEIRYAVNLTDGFLLVGNEFFASGQVSGYVARIDNQGDLQWTKILVEGAIGKLFSGIAADDGFVVLGLSSESIDGPSSVWAAKLDFSGNLVWSRTFGGFVDSAARSGVLAQDGNYLLAGYTDSKGNGNYDFCLMELNINGDIVWNNTYGGEGSQKAYSITKTDDGYVIVGDIQLPNMATDAWVLKVDIVGNVLWNKSVGGKDADSAAYVTISKDGGYLVAGFTFSFGAGNRDFWLFRISDSGEVLWSCIQGDKSFQEAYNVIDAGNNSYVMVGWTDPIGQPALIGKATYDFSIVKLSFSQKVSAFSSIQLVAYTVVAIAVSIVTLALLVKSRVKRKNKIKS
jgi:hypothetical protein